MVSISDTLGPFRITKGDLLQLARELDKRLTKYEDTMRPPDEWRFQMRLGKYSENCHDVGELERFLAENLLPRVVPDFRLVVSSPIIEYDIIESVTLDCDSLGAKYTIDGFSTVESARAIEDQIQAFRNNHKASSLCRPLVAMLVALFLVLILLLSSATMILPPPRWWLPEYRPITMILTICSAVLLLYVVWSSYLTRDLPSLSFHHSILYMDKEPKNSALWITVGTIIVAIVADAIWAYIVATG